MLAHTWTLSLSNFRRPRDWEVACHYGFTLHFLDEWRCRTFSTCLQTFRNSPFEEFSQVWCPMFIRLSFSYWLYECFFIGWIWVLYQTYILQVSSPSLLITYIYMTRAWRPWMPREETDCLTGGWCSPHTPLQTRGSFLEEGASPSVSLNPKSLQLYANITGKMRSKNQLFLEPSFLHMCLANANFH